ncbi:MAG: hypothetical protein WCI51_03265 [Lentisphaerota bacterium]
MNNSFICAGFLADFILGMTKLSMARRLNPLSIRTCCAFWSDGLRIRNSKEEIITKAVRILTSFGWACPIMNGCGQSPSLN